MQSNYSRRHFTARRTPVCCIPSEQSWEIYTGFYTESIENSWVGQSHIISHLMSVKEELMLQHCCETRGSQHVIASLGHPAQQAAFRAWRSSNYVFCTLSQSCWNSSAWTATCSCTISCVDSSEVGSSGNKNGNARNPNSRLQAAETEICTLLPDCV